MMHDSSTDAADAVVVVAAAADARSFVSAVIGHGVAASPHHTTTTDTLLGRSSAWPSLNNNNSTKTIPASPTLQQQPPQMRSPTPPRAPAPAAVPVLLRVDDESARVVASNTTTTTTAADARRRLPQQGCLVLRANDTVVDPSSSTTARAAIATSNNNNNNDNNNNYKSLSSLRNSSRSVVFREIVIVGYTHPKHSYDRTSQEVEPLTVRDVEELIALRDAMERETEILCRRRDEEEFWGAGGFNAAIHHHFNQHHHHNDSSAVSSPDRDSSHLGSDASGSGIIRKRDSSASLDSFASGSTLVPSPTSADAFSFPIDHINDGKGHAIDDDDAADEDVLLLEAGLRKFTNPSEPIALTEKDIDTWNLQQKQQRRHSPLPNRPEPNLEMRARQAQDNHHQMQLNMLHPAVQSPGPKLDASQYYQSFPPFPSAHHMHLGPHGQSPPHFHPNAYNSNPHLGHYQHPQQLPLANDYHSQCEYQYYSTSNVYIPPNQQYNGHMIAHHPGYVQQQQQQYYPQQQNYVSPPQQLADMHVPPSFAHHHNHHQHHQMFVNHEQRQQQQQEWW